MKKVWYLIFIYFVRYLPEKMGGVREYVVKKYIQAAGKNISIGRSCLIHKNTIIGDNSGVGYRCNIPSGVRIGNDVMMGPEVIMFTQNHETQRTDISMREQRMRDLQPITIEDDVWIGARACILPGVTIGKGAVVGAYTVVSKSVPKYAVYVGNPGRVVKIRCN